MNSLRILLASTLVLATACAAQPTDDHEMAGARPTGKADSASGLSITGDLTAGEAVESALADPSTRHGWLFFAQEGAVIDLEITRLGSSRSLDTLLTIHGPRQADGSFAEAVASDDEAGYGQLSKVSDLEIIQGGFYVAEVAAVDGHADFEDKQYRILLTCPTGMCEQPEVPLPNDIHWVRNSSEYVASTVQAYAAATLSLETASAAGTLPASWAVSLDVDETVLSNSLYQKERAALGLGYSPSSWAAWVARREAPTIAGAQRFLERVRALGGTIALVTNRKAAECADTEANARAQGVPFDVILCRTDVKDKQPRWDMVEDGTARSGVAAAEIVLWVGDNIHDFPGMEQHHRHDESAFSEFGTRFIQIPNPMYGSWTRNPRH